MRFLSATFALAAGVLVGVWGTAALSFEGGLTLPNTSDAPVVLTHGTGNDLVQPSDLLRVFVGASDVCCSGRTPMAGRYSVTDTTLKFDPAFDFEAGQTYTVETSQDGMIALAEFTLAAPKSAAPPHVIAVYPSGSVIPENTLRFYIHFSAPMQPHLSDNFITLTDAKGKADRAAFMTFKQELWSADRKRLTLLMDPGRIKRGVAQNRALGPALLENETYSLVIAAGWPSAISGEKTPRFEKHFRVSPALRTPPGMDLWRYETPRQGTRDPLIIRLDRPFDHQLAQRSIRVLDALGEPITGLILIEKDETIWRFQPDKIWTDPRIKILVDARLEDVAGNNFRDLLDHNLGTPIVDVDTQHVILDLQPAP